MSQTKPPSDSPGSAAEPDALAWNGDPVARAEAVVAAFAEEYLEWLRGDLDGIDRMVATGVGNPAVIDQLRRKAHDIRGQGGSFGYPLVTDLGDMLHQVVVGQPTGLTSSGVALVREIVDAMRGIVNGRAVGGQDAAARAAVDVIRRHVEQSSGKA